MATKIALVSIGKIARDQHIPAISASDDFELAAAVSRNSIVEGVDNFPDIDSMLAARSDIEVVSLCMPPAARFNYASKAINAGRHTMLEKPPGATLSECIALRDMAERRGVSLFATWHSRYAAAVPAAKAWMADNPVSRVSVVWKEDVRRWHPGQDWIWQAGGLGVFDPGINALSILTEIMPRAIFIKGATLEFPENCDTPIAAEISFHDPEGTEVSMVLDWQQEGPQTWDITAETDHDQMALTNGGAIFSVNGTVQHEGPDREYPNLYARMAKLLADRSSDVDLAPLTHVADAFSIGKRKIVEPFHF